MSCPVTQLSGERTEKVRGVVREHLFRKESPWLAPLAGYSDLPFRLLCREYGAAVCCTEMVSAKGLVYGSPGTACLLDTVPEDQPLVVQLFGNEADIMARAMDMLLHRGFRYFDLNMGCSVPKVTRTGCGAGLLRDLPAALEVARVMVAAADTGCVGFKMRLGWEEGQEVWQELALALEGLGAGWLTLHPRYARQKFGGVARWEVVRELAGKVHIPVIASGDLLTAEDGMRCLMTSGAATVMYARGAMQDPAIFADHRALCGVGVPLERSPGAVREMIRRHATLVRRYGDMHAALFKMRTFVPRYVHHFPGVRLLRQGLAVCRDWETLDRLLDRFLEQAEMLMEDRK